MTSNRRAWFYYVREVAAVAPNRHDMIRLTVGRFYEESLNIWTRTGIPKGGPFDEKQYYEEFNTFCYVHSDWYSPAFFNRSDTTDRKYDAANAYTGLFMRVDLWLEIRAGCRFHIAAYAFIDFFDAAALPDRKCNGF